MVEPNRSIQGDAAAKLGNGLPLQAPAGEETGRFILRFRGAGPKPAVDVAVIRKWHNIKVLDESSPRMLLVESSEREVARLLQLLPSWAMSCERDIELPDTRPKPRSRPKR